MGRRRRQRGEVTIGSFFLNGDIPKETLQSIIRCWTMCEMNADWAEAVRISHRYHIVDGSDVQVEFANGLKKDIEHLNNNYFANEPQERTNLIMTLALFRPIEEAFNLVDSVDRSTEIKFEAIWDESGRVLCYPQLVARSDRD